MYALKVCDVYLLKEDYLKGGLAPAIKQGTPYKHKMDDVYVHPIITNKC